MAKQKIAKVSMTARGEWDAGESYARLDIVHYGGSSWVAKTANSGVTPAENDYWTLLVERGDKGEKGFTPSVDIVETSTGATVTVTDESGTTTANIKNGAKGDKGDVGEKGFSPIAKVTKDAKSATITVQDETGTTTATVNDGFSPVTKVEATDTGATITVTDASGTTTANIQNGAKGDKGDTGDNGVSPVANVVRGEKSATVTITDATGTTTAVVNDGVSPTAKVEATDTGATITVTDASGTTTADISVIDIESLHPRFGVSGVGGSDAQLTRLWKSAELPEPVCGTDTIQCVSAYDAYVPFNRRKCVGNWVLDESGTKAKFNVQAYYGDGDYAEDGSMGDYVAIEITPFYWFHSGDILGVSEYKFPGWEIHPVCVDYDGNIREKTYAPCYQLAVKDGHAVSLPGLPILGTSYKDLWTQAQTYNNADVQKFAMLTPTAYEHYNYLLFTIEYATQNCQNKMQGAVNMRFGSSFTDKVIATPAANQAVISGNYSTTYVVGQTIAFESVSVWDTRSYYSAKERLITAITRCDEDGTVNASGTCTLITYDGEDYTASITLNTTAVLTMPWATGATGGYIAGVPAVNGHTGSPVSNTDGLRPMLYRWCENLWGNAFMTTHDAADVRVDNGDGTYHLEWYYNADPRKVTTPYNFGVSDLVESKGWVKLGIETTTENYRNGYVKQYDHTDEYPFYMIPTKAGGSASTYYCDYAVLVSSTAVRSVRWRGSLGNGSSDGLRYCRAGYAPSHARWYCAGELFINQ